MRKFSVAVALAGVALISATVALTPAIAQKQATPAYVSSALNDAARPKADRDRDAVREPAAMLAFAGIRPGTVIAEYIPGGGYFTRIFSKAVGPTGKVFAMISPPAAGRGPPAVRTIAADPGYTNVTVVEGNLAEVKTPTQVDLVWTSQNYHDLNITVRNAMNVRAFEELKPGGLYIVLDHSAVVGTGDYAMAQRPALHRIDENLVKLEVLRAGFTLVEENNILRNPADTRMKAVFEGSLNRDTDQFILKFRKPR